MKNKLLVIWERLVKLVKHFFDQSVWLRLLSIVIAVIIWASIISGEDAEWRDSAANIPIYVIGAEALEEKGLALKQDVDELVAEMIGSVTINYQGKKSAITSLNQGNLQAVIDLSKIFREGQGQTLNIEITGATGVDVQKISPVSSITVDVEELYTDENVPVTVVFTGALPEGYIRPSSEHSIYPSSLTVSGTQSDVQAIKHAYVEIDLTDVTNSISQQYEIVLTDENYNPIDAPTVKVSSPTVIVRTNIYKTKTVPIQWKGSFVGDVAPGYEIGDVTLIPEEVTIAGYEEDIENILQVYVNSIDVNGKTETMTENISFVTQTGVQWMSHSGAEITVEIAEERAVEVITSVPIAYINAPENSNVTLSSDTVTMAVDGPASFIRTLSRGDVRAYVNLISYSFGEFNIDIIFELVDDSGAPVSFSTSTVHVLIEELEETDESGA